MNENPYEDACETYAASMLRFGYDLDHSPEEHEAHTQSIGEAVTDAVRTERQRVLVAVEAKLCGEKWDYLARRIRELLLELETELGQHD